MLYLILILFVFILIFFFDFNWIGKIFRFFKKFLFSVFYNFSFKNKSKYLSISRYGYRYFSSHTSWKPQKYKSHPHHIIPYYKPKKLTFKNETAFTKFIQFIDKQLSVLPPYFSLVLSIFSLFLLFFIFLHKKEVIISFNSFHSYLYYFSLCFYIILLIHSFYKFLLHIFDEVRSIHIYTPEVESQYLLGISLFILSEAMLFFSFFWAFLHSSLSPSIYIGNCWPPLGITTLNAWHIPFLNTLILLTSGITVNWFFFTLRRFSYSIYRPVMPFGYYETVTTWFIILNALNFYWIRYQRHKLFKPNIFFFNNFFQTIKIFYFYNIFFLYIFSKNYYYMVKSSFLKFYNMNFFDFKYNFIIFFYKSKIYKKWFPYFYKLYVKIIIFLNNFFIYNYLYLKYLTTINSFVDTFYFDKVYAFRSFWNVYVSLFTTIYLGLMFLGFQYIEYKYYALFDIMNIYGTVFFLLTSLHGLHVYIGLFSLIICYSYFISFKLRKADLNKGVLLNFLIIFSVWYWHFVDVVWLLLFIIVYMWGS